MGGEEANQTCCLYDPPLSFSLAVNAPSLYAVPSILKAKAARVEHTHSRSDGQGARYVTNASQLKPGLAPLPGVRKRRPTKVVWTLCLTI